MRAELVTSLLMIAIALPVARARGEEKTAAAPVAAQPAPQFDVKLTAQDGANLNQICTFAMDSPQSLATKTAIGQICLDLLNRIGQAQHTAQEATKAQVPKSAHSALPEGEKK